LERSGGKENMNEFLMQILFALGLTAFVLLVLFFNRRQNNTIDNTKKEMSQEEKNLEEVKNTILLTSGRNEARPAVNRSVNTESKNNQPDVTFELSIDDVLNSISSKSTSTRGSRGPSLNHATPKQLMDQKVSTLRRILFHQGKSAEEAERTIDFYLKNNVHAQNYTKSTRRKNHVYAPIISKKKPN